MPMEARLLVWLHDVINDILGTVIARATLSLHLSSLAHIFSHHAHIFVSILIIPLFTRYMGGFTHSRDLRALYWSKDSPYDEQKKSYETPSPAAYVPHTVWQQIRAFHSSARRPYPSESYNEEHVVPNFYIKHKKDRKHQVDKLMKSSVTPSTTSPSATDTAGLDVAAAEEAIHDPTRQTKAVKRRKHEESALMEHLSDSILGDDLVASTRRLVSKIPVEHYDNDGFLVHPSGFVVPGKGHTSTSDAARAKEHARDEDEERAAQTASVAERVLESDFDHVHSAMASTRPRSHKVPFEIREPDGTVKHPSGFVPPTPADEFKYSDSASLERGLAGAISRQRARDVDNKNSTIIKGRRLHTTAVVRASEVAIPTHLMQPVPAPEINSQASLELSESEPDHVGAIRAKYLPTLAQESFFRPHAVEQDNSDVLVETRGAGEA
ncbi:uncharacterized protein F5891DRAFT_1028683 [Suillus fuscotomentosus]|uniref:Uncharacterized protein n=1 Tax=Suillus fuscotomentosus TaxID=1912939 RepID=A0AAD4E808_9AGAM|nr:uncharacterized protein F5891DRAFT_1028683 [Suillus fuscotomentosus]KAG1901265.1 hypothetical protein F5891DRAFT_1028683 [Suillus fuscotomentosus]